MVEQRPFKPKVVGSIPTAPTKINCSSTTYLRIPVTIVTVVTLEAPHVVCHCRNERRTREWFLDRCVSESSFRHNPNSAKFEPTKLRFCGSIWHLCEIRTATGNAGDGSTFRAPCFRANMMLATINTARLSIRGKHSTAFAVCSPCLAFRSVTFVTIEMAEPRESAMFSGLFDRDCLFEPHRLHQIEPTILSNDSFNCIRVRGEWLRFSSNGQNATSTIEISSSNWSAPRAVLMASTVFSIVDPGGVLEEVRMSTKSEYFIMVKSALSTS